MKSPHPQATPLDKNRRANPLKSSIADLQLFTNIFANSRLTRAAALSVQLPISLYLDQLILDLLTTPVKPA